MAKINFDKKLYTLDGKTVLKQKITNEKGMMEDQEINLKSVCVQTLMSAADNAQKPLPAEKKLRYWELGRKINAGGEIDLPSEDITALKEVIGEFPSVLIVGQATDLLEGRDPFRKEK